MNETEKPFACAREGCKMAFTNEDHLNVHKKKHDMALHLGIDSQNNTVVADQTPTPTRFIRNCEEVGLFQDLQNVNPFDETFRKATELSKAGTLHIPEVSTDDTLHTPHIFPHIEAENNISKFSRNNSNEPEFTVTIIDDALLKLTNKDEITEPVVDSSGNNDAHMGVISLSDESSDSENFERNSVITSTSCTLISKDNLIGNNAAPSTIPVSIPLANSDLPPVIVNNLSDIEISINRNDVIQERNHSENAKNSSKPEETLKSKLKQALKNKFRTEENEFDDHDTILIQKVESSSMFSAVKPQLMKPLQRRVLHKHSTAVNSKIKLSDSHSDSSSNKVRNIFIEDGPQSKRSLCRSRILLSNTQLERQREVNRAAQMRSREKKKYWINQMESEITLLKDEKKELWLENQRLKNEIIWLKTMLLYHKDCPVARDPQTMEEINTIVKTSQEELHKKMQKSPPIYPTKKMVPIRPNPTNVIALTSVPSSLLVQVPGTLPPIKKEPQTPTRASTPNNASAPVNTLPTFVPCSVVSSGQNISKQNSQNIQIAPSATSNIIIGIVNNSNSTPGNIKNSKFQPNIIKAKDKLKPDRKLRNLKINPANIVQLQNAILPDDNYFIVAKPSGIQNPKNKFKNS